MPPASYIVTVSLAALLLVLGNRATSAGKLFAEEGAELIRARALTIVSVEKFNYSEDDEGLVMTTVTFDAKALHGPRRRSTAYTAWRCPR